MLARLALALLLLAAFVTPASAEGLDEIAAEAAHMTADIAKAKTASPAEARALAKEIADHASESEEALDKAVTTASATTRTALEGALGGSRRVTAAGLAVQRAADADVRTRVNDLEAAVQAFVPQLQAAIRAARPAPPTLPRTGGLPAPASALLAGLALLALGAHLIRRIH